MNDGFGGQANQVVIVPAPEQIAGAHSKKRTRRTFLSYCTPIAFVLDFLAICAGLGVALLLHNLWGGARVGSEPLKIFSFSLQYTIAFILFGRIHSLYSYEHNLLQIRDTSRILRVSSFCLLLLSVESFFSKMVVPRGLLVLGWAFITLFVLLEKHAVRRMFARWKVKHAHQRQVLILGAGPEARRIFSYLLNSPDLQLSPVGFFEERPSDDTRVVYSHDYRFRDHAMVYRGQLDGPLLKRLNISEIFVADPTLSPHRLSEIAALSWQHNAPLSFVGSAHAAIFGNPVNLREMDGLFITSFSGEKEISLGYEFAKRLLDLVVAIFMIVATLPLWIVAAVWIKLSSKGPVFFQQERIGRDEKPFKMYKFRSMYVTAPKYGASPQESSDPRITSAGQFLRKTSLDELPQLINVVLGQMSLVGPRPEMPYVVSQYTPQQKQRCKVQQGLTGMWQLSADRKFAIHESLEYDLYYIENRGFFLDLAILLHTAAFAMKGV